MLVEEQEYKSVVSALKSLKKVNAPEYFEANLMRKIHTIENTKLENKKASFWDSIFVKRKLIPSAALSVAGAAFLVFLLINIPNDGNNNSTINSEKSQLKNKFQSEKAEANSIDKTQPSKVKFKPVYLSPEEKEKIKELKERTLKEYDEQNTETANPNP